MLLLEMELPLTSSAADSPVRTSPLRARAPASRASAAVYGRSTPELLARFDRDTSSWRMSQPCLIEGYREFSETWPRSGTMRSGIAFQLPPLVRLTGGTGSGLWLTPSVEDCKPAGQKEMEMTARYAAGESIPDTYKRLRTQAATWPTPRSTDADRGGRGDLIQKVRGNSNPHFATPTARDWRSGKASAATHSRNVRPLSEQIGGALNPTFVEWLMGFPLGWTDCGVSATPSSRKSRK